jgi:hypothetical protein
MILILSILLLYLDLLNIFINIEILILIYLITIIVKVNNLNALFIWFNKSLYQAVQPPSTIRLEPVI